MTNEERASSAEEALAAFTDYGFEPPEELATYVGDLLVNLLHLCDQRGISFAACLERARGHFEYERSYSD